MSEVEGFVWCSERWTDVVWGKRGPHICAEHKPGHEIHKCCCGAIKDEEGGND